MASRRKTLFLEIQRLNYEIQQLQDLRDQFIEEYCKLGEEPLSPNDAGLKDETRIESTTEFCQIVRSKVRPFNQNPHLPFQPRGSQVEVFETYKARRDAICINGTGAGKSMSKFVPPLREEYGLSVFIEFLHGLAIEQTHNLNQALCSDQALLEGKVVAITTCNDNEYDTTGPTIHDEEKTEAPTITQMYLPYADGSIEQQILAKNSIIRYLVTTPEALCPPPDAPKTQFEKARRLVQMLTEMNRLGRLQQIVLDELHLFWCHRKFRKAFAQLRDVIRCIRSGRTGVGTISALKNVPLLGLTATLCSNQLGVVIDMAGFDKDAVILKRTTDRPELSYTILDLGYVEGTNDEVMRKSLDLLMPSILLSAKTMIFVATRSDCEVLAGYISNQMIPTWVYHGALSKKQQRENWEAWSSEQKFAVIVSTSLGGTGRNQPMVDLVIQLTVRPNIYSMVQELGRAGRQGQKSRCIIVAHPIFLHRIVSFVDFDDAVENRMFRDVIELVYSRGGCIRQKIQSLLGDELFCAGQCPSPDDEDTKGTCSRCDITITIGSTLTSLVDVTYPAIALLKEISQCKHGANYVETFNKGNWRNHLVPCVASGCFMYVLINYLRLSKASFKNETGCFSVLLVSVDEIRSAHAMSHRNTIWIECISSHLHNNDM